MISWGSYSKIYGLGHAAITDLFQEEVTIEEKIDGSQFSFGKFGDELKFRSKGKVFSAGEQDPMFDRAVASVQELEPKLKDGYTYRGEYLQKLNHSSLTYNRIPKNHIILFDISPSKEAYLSYGEKIEEAQRIGLEVVPLLFMGKVSGLEHLKELLERESILGGPKIEGFVIKNYKRFCTDGKAMMGKHVSEAFKEVHRKEWKNSNPTGKDVLATMADSYRTEARWHKAMQHIKERGELTQSPKDIGPLLKEIQNDIKAECEQEIKDALFKWAWPNISRVAIRGFAEFYKNHLMEKQFDAKLDTKE